MCSKTTSSEVVFVVYRELQGGNNLELYTNLRKGEKGAWLSIGVYILLSSVKYSVGLIGDSEALRADGLNNFTDIIASVAVLIGLRISQKPPDDQHAYGHLRAETIASLTAAFIMAFIGLQVVLQSLRGFANPVHESPSLLTLWVGLWSAVVMYGVYRYNVKLANKIDSSALRAAAMDNRSDALVSLGASIGIIGAIVGFPILDTITAFIVGVIILYTAYSIFYEAAFDLSDGFSSDDSEALSVLVSYTPGVFQVLDLKGRMHGNQALIDVTVTVDPYLNVIESHWITEEIERKVRKTKPHAIVLVHIEPEYDLVEDED